MKAEELVGRLAVRVREVTSGHGYLSLGGPTKDSGYTHEPVFIEAVESDVVYIRDQPNGDVQILSARYRDDNWAPISERFTPKKWKEAPADEQAKQ